MTHDEREKLSRTQESLAGLHRQLQEANLVNRSFRWWLTAATVVLLVLVFVAGALWWDAFGSQPCLSSGQERAGDLVAMKAQAEWYASQKLRLEEDLGKWQTRSLQDLAARKVAEQELADVLASRVKWNTSGTSPLDLPPLTMEQVKKRLIAYEGEPVVKEETLVEPKSVSIRQRLMKALGSETMKGLRAMVRP